MVAALLARGGENFSRFCKVFCEWLGGKNNASAAAVVETHQGIKKKIDFVLNPAIIAAILSIYGNFEAGCCGGSAGAIYDIDILYSKPHMHRRCFGHDLGS